MRLFIILMLAAIPVRGIEISGTIQTSSNAPAPMVRMTLFTTNLLLFREVRSDAKGNFLFTNVANGVYELGAALRGFEYVQRTISIVGEDHVENFTLKPETNGGRWSIIGNTAPELLDGTGSGTLLPTGEILYCHDTEDPVVFDPVTRLKWFPPTSGSGQGCHIPTLNTDGALFFAGGSVDGYPQGTVVKTVKLYWRNTNRWSRLPDMNLARWYPSLVRLPNERLMVLGGEQNGSPNRTDACETYDPLSKRWNISASFDLPSELIPTVLLYNGEVFKTWRTPELYNVASNTWRAAPRMIQERVGTAEGDHCDHDMVFLADGRVMTVGIFPKTTNENTRFVEFYSPELNQWSLGPNPRYLRNRPEAVLLPDHRVLAFGGQYSDLASKPRPPLRNAGTIPNCTRLTDIYDPQSNSWRAGADMNRFVHYHNVTVLVPDGRVIATGGAGLTANNSFAGDDMSIEAYEPPYLFRGVRPQITSLASHDLKPGGSVEMEVAFTESPTEVVLTSARASTHWVDGGPQRQLSLPFTQSGTTLRATVPDDPVKALAGWYILFVLVDDIPSQGRMIRVLPDSEPLLSNPGVSLNIIQAVIDEERAEAEVVFSRTGSTNAPLRIDFDLSGSALNGADYDAVVESITILAGQSSATLRLSPKEDLLSEGDETVSVSLMESAAYSIISPGAGSVTIRDVDGSVPSPSLSLRILSAEWVELSYEGPSSRLLSIEASHDLRKWTPFSSGVSTSNRLDVVFPKTREFEFFRTRQQP